MGKIESQETSLLATTFNKSDCLIMARFDYSLICNQILSVALSKVKKINNEYSAKFTVMEIENLVQKKYKGMYDTVKQCADRMSDTKICIEDPETGKFEFHQLIPTFTYNKGNCEIIFNTRFNDVIENLAGSWTAFNLETLGSLDSVNSFRLYETLKSKAYYPKWYKGVRNGKYRVEFTISELRVMLNAVDISRKEIKELMRNKESIDYDLVIKVANEIAEKEANDDKIKKIDKFRAPKWEKYNIFNRDVLKPSIEEINKKTEYRITYETDKKRNATSVIFYIEDLDYKGIKDEIIDIEPEQTIDIDDLIDEVRDFIDVNVSTKDVRSLLLIADNNIDKVKKAYAVVKDKKYDDFMAYMIKAIKEDWEPPIKSNKKKSEHGFEGRDYDWDEIENKFLA